MSKDSSGDTWHKPRKRSDHFSEAEISVCRDGFVNRRRIHLVAQSLQCASRTVAKYYGFFRAEGIEQIPKPTKGAKR